MDSEDSISYDIDPNLIVKDSIVRGSIPVLPLPMATVLFGFNVILPGSGEFLFGIKHITILTLPTRQSKELYFQWN